MRKAVVLTSLLLAEGGEEWLLAQLPLSFQKYQKVPCVVGQPSKARSDCKELKMLCAEDEQSRTCWMTAFRLLKVGPLPVKATTNRISQHLFKKKKKMTVSCPTVRDRVVPELQRSTAEEVQPFTVLRARGEDLLSGPNQSRLIH